MRCMLVCVALASSAYADTFPKTGPCEDVDACDTLCKRKTAACTYGGFLALQSAVDDAMKERAQTLFVRGCAKGDGEACWFAARRAPDEAAARKLYDKACAKQHVRACFAAAKAAGAAGDAKATKAAAVIYKKAAKYLEPRCTKKKEYFACDGLANMYGSGQGVAQDAKKAEQYRQRACQIKTGQPCPPPQPPPPPPGPPRTKAD